MSDLIIVRSGYDNPRRVALWETDERHPKGEVFVTGQRGDVTVFPTPLALYRLRQGTLVQVGTVNSEKDEPADESPAVSTIDGIGKTTEKKLNAAGVFTVADLQAADLDELSEATGLSVERLEGWKSQES